MKAFQKIVVVLLMILGMSVGLSAEVKNFFINGVNNSGIKSKESAKEIERAIPEIGEVNALHNKDISIYADFIEADLMMRNIQKFYLNEEINPSIKISTILKDYSESGLFNSSIESMLFFADIYKSLDGEDSYKKERDFVDDLRSLIENDELGLSFSLKYRVDIEKVLYSAASIANVDFYDRIVMTLGELKKNYKTKLLPLTITLKNVNEIIETMNIQKGDKLNIIAHSQGNSFANILADLLSEEVGKENIRVLAVATPESRVFPFKKSNTPSSSYITLKEDMVSWKFTGLSPNFTNTKKSVLDIVLKDYDGDSVKELYANMIMSTSNYKKYNDPTGHGFRECYMKKGTKSREWIKKYFLQNYEELKALDEPEKRENLWLSEIELEGYGSNVPQMKKIKFDSRVHYSSNKKPNSLKVKICYALSKTPRWNKSDFVRGPRYSTKIFTTKKSSQKISDVSFYIPKTIPLGEYYLLEKVDCDNEIEETDEIENQVQYKKIIIIPQEKEDIRTTDVKISGIGSGKIVIKNTMVYNGSDLDIGWVYQAYFFSNKSEFSTAKQFFITKAKMGWGKNSRKRKQLTIDISKLPVGKFYIWVIVKKIDNSHDDNFSNNYFKVSFATQPKNN